MEQQVAERRETTEFLGALVDAGVISKDAAVRALRGSPGPVVDVVHSLAATGVIKQEAIMQLLELHYQTPYVDLDNTLPDMTALHLVPEELARRHCLLPIAMRDGELMIAMADPLDVVASDAAGRAAGVAVRPVLAGREQILQAIERHYSHDSDLEAAAAEIGMSMPDLGPEDEVDSAKLEKLLRNAPVVDFVNAIISRAIEQRASDIHVEPGSPKGVVRVRVDGVLQDIAVMPPKACPAIVSRLKVLSEMDIGQRRVPQDGRFSMTVEGRRIDFRVSSLPTMRGEKIVMRILDKSKGQVSVDKLGLGEAELTGVQKAMARPHGIFIVTGPTGSGKTTTLYSVLQGLDRLGKNIVTCEDPVEYELERINQVQLNTTAGLTFSGFLRSALRQDPDIIMVGEMRDAETASLAVRAALTGHLVLTTLHTNDAVGVTTRLADMGVEPFLVASTLVCAIAQRLVRTICPQCKEKYQLSGKELASAFPELADAEEFTACRGHGCRFCGYTGYVGRRALFEVFTPDRETRELIATNADSGAIAQTARAGGMASLREAAVREIYAGTTTLEEASRVTAEAGS